MPVWKDNILGLVPEQDWLSIGFTPKRQNDPIDGLFDDIRTDNLVAYWQTIASEYQIPMMAQFHAFDTEAQTTFRVPVDTHYIEKGLVKVKINQSERMRALLRSGVREDALYDYVIRDGARLAEQVITRSKVAKNELMATGKITIKENNLNLSPDYGVTADQTAFELDLSPDADVPAQLQAIVDAALKKGVTLTGFQTARKNITKMRNNAALKNAINGDPLAMFKLASMQDEVKIKSGAILSMSALSSYLETEFGLGRIVTNDLTYGAEAEIGTDGRPNITTARYYPDNKITFFAANPVGRLGTVAWGDPPEATVGSLTTATSSSESPYVYIDQWTEDDPKVLWTKASALFIPVLYNPSSLWIATVVDNSNTLKSLTVTSAAGTASGTTKLTVTPAKASGNLYKYKAAASATPVVYGQNVQTWTAWNGTDDITATAGQVVTVVECGSDYKAVGSGNTTVTAKA